MGDMADWVIENGISSDIEEGVEGFIIVDNIIRETEKAWLLCVEDKECWFPKSLCSLDTEGMAIFLYAPIWLIESKGTDYET